MLVLIAIALFLLFLALMALAYAQGLTLPIFDQIAQLLQSLTVPGG